MWILSQGGGLAAKSCPTLLVHAVKPDRESVGFSGKKAAAGCHCLTHLSLENPNILQKAENRTISPQCLQ